VIFEKNIPRPSILNIPNIKVNNAHNPILHTNVVQFFIKMIPQLLSKLMAKFSAKCYPILTFHFLILHHYQELL